MSIDVMKQALEVLSLELPVGSHLELKSALRAAIEQAQEPIAWVYPEALAAFEKGDPWVAYGSNGDQRIPLYPAPRQWQGLTDAERGITAAETWGSVLIAPQSYQAFARAIEAKLRDKNA